MLHSSNGSKKPTQFEQDLAVYPPRLRRLAHFILNSTSDSTTLAEWCREAGMPYGSIRDAVSKSRLRGNDYKDLINKIAYEKLTSQKPLAYKKLMEGVQKSSHRHLELYFTLIGDLKKEPKSEGNTTTNNLTFVLSMSESIPQPAISEHNGAED